MTLLLEAGPEFPICNADESWWAFPRAWPKRRVVRELTRTYADWWLGEQLHWDEDDRQVGWFAAYRYLFDNIEQGWLRPYDPERDREWVDDPEWWFACDPSEPHVEAWVIRLDQ